MSRPLMKLGPERLGNNPKAWKTFDKWSSKGFYINKGSKSPKRDDKGRCLFHKSQVHKATEYIGSSEYYNGLSDEDDYELASAYGLTGYEGIGFFP